MSASSAPVELLDDAKDTLQVKGRATRAPYFALVKEGSHAMLSEAKLFKRGVSTIAAYELRVLPEQGISPVYRQRLHFEWLSDQLAPLVNTETFPSIPPPGKKRLGIFASKKGPEELKRREHLLQNYIDAVLKEPSALHLWATTAFLTLPFDDFSAFISSGDIHPLNDMHPDASTACARGGDTDGKQGEKGDEGSAEASVGYGKGDIEGWLLKRGQVDQSWRRRFFVCDARSKTMTYYLDKKCAYEDLGARARRNQRGSIAMLGASLTVHRPGNYDRPHVFSVSPASISRVFLLSASTERDRDAFLRALEAISGTKSTVGERFDAMQHSGRVSLAGFVTNLFSRGSTSVTAGAIDSTTDSTTKPREAQAAASKPQHSQAVATARREPESKTVSKPSARRRDSGPSPASAIAAASIRARDAGAPTQSFVATVAEKPFGFKVKRCVVVAVTPGGEAHKENIKVGDRVTVVSGIRITSNKHLQSMFGSTPMPFKIRIERTVVDVPQPIPEENPEEKLLNQKSVPVQRAEGHVPAQSNGVCVGHSTEKRDRGKPEDEAGASSKDLHPAVSITMPEAKQSDGPLSGPAPNTSVIQPKGGRIEVKQAHAKQPRPEPSQKQDKRKSKSGPSAVPSHRVASVGSSSSAPSSTAPSSTAPCSAAPVATDAKGKSAVSDPTRPAVHSDSPFVFHPGQTFKVPKLRSLVFSGTPLGDSKGLSVTMSMLHAGSYVIKHCRISGRRNKSHSCRLWLSEDRKLFWGRAGTRDAKSIDTGRIKEMFIGHSPSVSRLTWSDAQKAASFHVIASAEETRKGKRRKENKILAIICQSRAVRDAWIQGLDSLVALNTKRSGDRIQSQPKPHTWRARTLLTSGVNAMYTRGPKARRRPSEVRVWVDFGDDPIGDAKTSQLRWAPPKEASLYQNGTGKGKTAQAVNMHSVVLVVWTGSSRIRLVIRGVDAKDCPEFLLSSAGRDEWVFALAAIALPPTAAVEKRSASGGVV